MKSFTAERKICGAEASLLSVSVISHVCQIKRAAYILHAEASALRQHVLIHLQVNESEFLSLISLLYHIRMCSVPQKNLKQLY